MFRFAVANRANKTFTQRPSFLESAPECMFCNAKSFGPFYRSEGNPIVSDNSVRGAITSLLFRCCPSAIFRCVWSIVVNTVKLMLRGGPFAHIGKEVLKIQPRGANGNTSAAISRIASSFGIQTPRFHRAPDIKLRRIGSAVSKPVALSKVATFFKVCAGNFFMKTTTGLNVAITHCRKQYRCLVATFAQALNNNLTVSVSTNHVFNNKTARCEADKLFV